METFKIINRISDYERHLFFFLIFLSELEICYQRKFNILNLFYQLDFFFANRIIYFWNKLPNQIRKQQKCRTFED